MVKPNKVKLSTEFVDMSAENSHFDANVIVLQETAADEMDEIMSQIDMETLYEPERKVDEMDEIMSQIDMETLNKPERKVDEMDEIMSQIDMKTLHEPKRKVDDLHITDEMDEIMSQFDMESLYDPEKNNDIPLELRAHYENAMNQIEDYLILQMEEEDDTEIETELPPELLKEYEKAMMGILPKKSTDRYMQAYEVFRSWQKSHRTKSLDEVVVMAYFSEASSKYKPSTVWSMYSMLKKTFIVKHNVDLKTYCRLRAFLKTNSDGFQSKKSLVFSADGLKNFIMDAPDITYLAMKVILIFGVVGVCRGDELTNLTIGNVKDDGNEISVHIPMTKTKQPKDYIICGEMAKIIREYFKLRPNNAKTDRLLMQYRKGKCVNQVMGKHSIAKIPKEIAKFLKLPEPNLYTGHSYRRTGTTIAADAGASMEELMRLGPWKSISVCQRYIQDSKTNKRKLSNLIGGAINLPETSQNNTNNNGTIYVTNRAINLPSTSKSGTENREKRLKTEPSYGETSNEHFPEENDFFETKNPSVVDMASDEVKLNSTALKSLSETLKGLDGHTRGNKENVVLHFSSECKNFTIINLN